MKVSLDDKYSLDKGKAFMTGIEALVRLPILQHQRDLEQGLNTACFISGYRGSPIGGLDQALWRAEQFTEAHNIHFLPGINEDLAMTSVWGSQQVGLFPGARYDGVFGMWYGKGPGLDRSMDVLKHANAFGTSPHGGVLAVVGDDHACKSSTLPHQSDHMFIGATAPVLNPTGVQEVLDLGIFGWELSRYSGCWVGLKAITENMDAAISAEIDPSRVNVVIPDDYELPADGVHTRWPDTPMAQEERLQRHKIYAARAFARANNLNRIELDSDNARLGIITTGKSYLDTLQALSDLGIDEKLAAKIGIRLYKVGMSWPLEPVVTHQFADGLEEILVVEEKRSVIEDQLTGQLYNWPVSRRPSVVGEYDEDRNLLVTNLGELTPAMIARVIAARISRFFDSKSIQKRLEFLETKEAALAKPRRLAERKPWYCSGCPHNTSTVVPEGSRAYGGIGCHYMATWMDRGTETFTQMGGEGATWLGQAPFTETRHVFQNLGDGTYFHSGLLAIRAAVAAGVNITYKILYNDAVAMTGGQALDGKLSVAQLIEQLRAEGVKRIAVVSDQPQEYRNSPFSNYDGISISHRRQLDSIQRELRDTEGCTALIYAQTCAAEKRRRRKKGILEDPPKRVFINDAVCEGCGDCGVQSNCLSIIPKPTLLGRKRAIDQSACNKDYSCVRGFCPSFVTVHGGQLRKRQAMAETTGWPAPEEPQRISIDGPFNILITGIGGTGILTVGSVMGMAAHIEQKGVSVLNQTGLAQKFGAVTGHVRVADYQHQIYSVRIPAGEAHLLLGADLVVSAADDALAKLNRKHSYAVINSHLSPTAEFTHDPDAVFPIEDMEQAIAGELETGHSHFIRATALSTRLLGDAIYSNFLLLGAAYQKGLIPISAEAIDEAIALNGVAIEQNQQAFLWGRRYVIDPTAVLDEAGLANEYKPAEPEATLDDVIAYRSAYLADYQDQDYAKRYQRLVERVHTSERELHLPGENAELLLTDAVARSYFNLLAYKDEYEVARLYSNGDFEQALATQFEGDYRLRFHLAPPLLAKRDPHSGKLLKREFGGWVMPLFRLLARFKKLRGSALDIFGYTAERKMERALIADYERDIEQILAEIIPQNHEIAVEIASLPLDMRGFGHVKQANIENTNRRRDLLLRKLSGRDLAVELFNP
ncbi:MAG: indolepyruvate ferredoxin oxidoreductase family protein [Gammaproteobacteria bacterium]|nr:indolepyruvate ferredoxin oxidoreductase family protein [Gammaproteobacteria bacterium]